MIYVIYKKKIIEKITPLIKPMYGTHDSVNTSALYQSNYGITIDYFSIIITYSNKKYIIQLRQQQMYKK